MKNIFLHNNKMKKIIFVLLAILNSQLLAADSAVSNRLDVAPSLSLPATFDSLTITHGSIVRADTGHLSFKIRVNAHLPAPGLIANAQLVYFPNHILIDKDQNIGVFEEKLDADGADVYMETGHQGEFVPYPDKLYVLSIVMTNGTKFIRAINFGKTPSPTTPAVITPSVEQIFTTGNPTFSWNNFYSPEWKRSEKRKAYVRVYKGSDPVWAAFLPNAGLTQITVGQAASQEGVSMLDPGEYKAHLVYRELRKNNRIWIGREYRTIVPFSVSTN
jgi:hypothetical protein